MCDRVAIIKTCNVECGGGGGGGRGRNGYNSASTSGRDNLDAVTFDEFLVMYVNHRPIFCVSKEQIAEAFATLSVDGGGILSRDSLLRALASHDESLTGDDLAQCLKMLVGSDDPSGAIPDQVDAKIFAEHVLGFQDYATGG